MAGSGTAGGTAVALPASVKNAAIAKWGGISIAGIGPRDPGAFAAAGEQVDADGRHQRRRAGQHPDTQRRSAGAGAASWRGSAAASRSATALLAAAASKSGAAAKTIRYYEETGLIGRAERRSNRYRSFSDSDVALLRFVGRARRLGFSLTDIKSNAAATAAPIARSSPN